MHLSSSYVRLVLTRESTDLEAAGRSNRRYRVHQRRDTCPSTSSSAPGRSDPPPHCYWPSAASTSASSAGAAAGPEHPAIERVAADATDAERLTRLASGAAALYNCASPQYHQWFTDWPPLAAALLTAAERSGAVLASMSNLYSYGQVDGPITQKTPMAATHPKLRLRGEMWQDALAAHEAGRIRTTEVRASDYIEQNSLLSTVIGKPLLTGSRGYSPWPLDVPHSWTSIADCARALATVATDERALGQVWLVPTNPALTVRQLATQVHRGQRRAEGQADRDPVRRCCGLRACSRRC